MWYDLSEPAAPEDVAAVVELARRAAARPGAPGTTILAIDGPSGSGKTTLAAGVAHALGCPVVHMDELYPGWDGLAAAVPLLVTHVLDPTARGEAAAHPVWDWERDAWGPSRAVPPGPFLIVEGCGSSVGAAGPYAAVRVWLEAPRAERMARGLARDGQTYAPHWQRWSAQEDALYTADGTRGRAHLVIGTGATPRAARGDGPPPGRSGHRPAGRP